MVGLALLLRGAPWWAGLLDHIEPLTATAAIVAVSGTLLASRSRHGLGWNVARLLCIAVIIIAIAMASLVAVCIPSGCFN
jgi:hypothetical protein